MSEATKTIVETEWSYFWDIDSMNGAKESVLISPNADEKQRLCQRLGLESIQELKADIQIGHPSGASAYHIHGHISGEITQNCVVSLEPVVNRVDESFDAWFADPDSAVSIAKVRHEKDMERGHGEVEMLDEQDDPEAIIDGKIDLGEVVTQFLSLSIDPYPHAEGAAFEGKNDQQDGDDEPSVNNPFAALKDWKNKLASED